MKTCKKRVVIVGAGIAGITAAGLLTKQGWDVLLLEKNKSFVSGISICLPDNANQCLKKLGILDTVLSQSFQAHSWDVLSNDGTKISSINLEHYFGSNRIFITSHRDHLHNTLAKIAPCSINFSLSINAIEKNDDKNITIKFNNGETQSFDLMIVADGIYSSTRKFFFPEITVNYLKVACYRMLVDRPEKFNAVKFILGEQGFMLLHPVDKKTIYCGVVFPLPTKENLPVEMFSEIMQKFVKASGNLKLQKSSLPLPGWMETVSSPVFFSGRAVFIGDASHGCATSLQQGAAQALEDTITLSTILENNDSIFTALQKYREIREAKVRWVMEQSNDCMRALNAPLSDSEKTARNEKIKVHGLANFVLWKDLFSRNHP